MPYIRVTSKRQATFPKAVLEKLGAKAGDILEVLFLRNAVELRPAKRNILDLMGSVKVKGTQDFKSARESALEKVAEESADEGRAD
ncbi:MAG: AbrB/MazE/SpoVT family DNA-binding domain-containing protein [Firmicutes bacterium]|nr:AbrB/MazE/SpoVT family DNA-binding domain-containing protein [Bacillota bacterium]